MLLLFSVAWAAPLASCTRTFDTSELSSAVTAAERAFSEMNSGDLAIAAGDVRTRLVCIGERLDPEVLARVHRVEALSAYVTGNQGHVPVALAGVIGAEPGHDIPTSLVPEDHPIREQRRFATKLYKDGLPRPLMKPESGWFEVDGDPNHVPTTSSASIIQQIDGQGMVVETRYLWPEDDLGAWAKVDTGTVATTSTTTTAPRAHAVPRAALTFDVVSAAPAEGSDVVSPGQFSGLGPGLDVGIVVPLVKKLYLGGDLGFQAMARNDAAIDMQAFRLWAGPGLQLGSFQIEAGPTFVWANMNAARADLAGRGALGGLTTAVNWRFAKAGPVGLGARAQLSYVAGGQQGLGWLGLGLTAAWEGA